MQTSNIRVIILTERDCRLAAANAGLEVELSPGTSKVVIKVIPDDKESEEGR